MATVHRKSNTVIRKAFSACNFNPVIVPWMYFKAKLLPRVIGVEPKHQCNGAYQVALLVKNPSASARDARDMGSVPGSGRSPGGGNGNPLQSSCLENPMDREAWVGYSPWGPTELETTKSDLTQWTRIDAELQTIVYRLFQLLWSLLNVLLFQGHIQAPH